MLGSGDRVLVTGATGFIGSAVTRALVARDQEVVALVEPGADAENLIDLPVKQVIGDLRIVEDMRKAVSGCRAVFHVAALYRFWARDPTAFYDINVGGTRNVLEAAGDAGVEGLVYTSTVGTLGLEAVSGSNSADERSFPDVRHLYGSYKRSKYVAEHEVLRAVAEGFPASLVMPTFPLGRGDRAPTPTGRLVLGGCRATSTPCSMWRTSTTSRPVISSRWNEAGPVVATSWAARTSPWRSCCASSLGSPVCRPRA